MQWVWSEWWCCLLCGVICGLIRSSVPHVPQQRKPATTTQTGPHLAPPALHLPHRRPARQGPCVCISQRRHRHDPLHLLDPGPPVGAAAEEPRAVGGGLGEHEEDGQT